MKTNTGTLSGAALDLAAWVALGGGFELDEGDIWLTRDGIAELLLYRFTPSKDWGQAGEIITKNRISLRFWDNVFQVSAYLPGGEWQTAECPLTAAMRAFVASKIGEEVDVPDSLVN